MRHTVMVVEDDEAIREAYVDLLEIEGYAVISAINGSDALEKLKKLKASEMLPDLIVTDLMMPIMNGNRFIELLRSDKELGKLPIVVISAISFKNDRGIPSIRKPLSIESFIRSISQYCA